MKYNKIMQELQKNNTYNEKQDVYIIASIDGEENHIGRIKNISLDADNDIVIEIDIDKESVTG